MSLENFETKDIDRIKREDFIDKDKLRQFGIAEKDEDILSIFQQVVDSIAEIEATYSNNESVDQLKKNLLKLLKDKKLIPSTPILMNAGRIKEAPLSACAVPPVDLRGDFSKLKTTVDYFHNSGMGTGFNFDEMTDPIEIIQYLNHVGVEGQKSDKQLRPVGNIGSLSVTHPKIINFIEIKNNNNDTENPWVFNFSVNLDDDAINKFKQGERIILKDGKSISSTELLNQIAESIYISGEPGLVFIDRLNRDNQVPSAGEYKSMAPCGEVGLVEGETCQFSYLNLGRFVEAGQLNYEDLSQAIELTMRLLDDVVDYNIARYKNSLSKEITKRKRKVGLGVCGFADLLDKLKIKYNSPESIELAENIFSFINFVSKKASLKLAIERGAFEDFKKSKYVTDENIIKRFSQQKTQTVSKDDWLGLETKVKKYGIRNCSTTALPPTGRSSLIVKASQSIEPFFKEALEISPRDQLLMISAIQKFIDESISKTINVSQTTSIDEIKAILLMAMDLNLKGITIYRDKSRNSQPIIISK